MKNKTTPIIFSDLTYTKQGIASHTFPMGISCVAAYTKKNMEFDVEIFKYPDKLAAYLERIQPKIACFSSYSWNNNLSYEFAEKIKKRNPRTVIVFGGPNYPLQKEEQKEYLVSYPAIDFYIRGEGEKAFLELFKILSSNEFDAEKIKRKGISIPSTQHLYKGHMIESKLMPRISNLDEIPSPYVSGILDKFFGSILNPMIQTTRGCPFTCAYCQDGNEYFNKIARLSPERVKQDLEYIAERVMVPTLIIVDDNFGMYKEDLITAKAIAEIRKKNGWPKYIDVATGKNNHECVLECITRIGGQIDLSASVQSTNPIVLQNIKRNNISLAEMIKLTKSGERLNANSSGEIILGLPGDSKKTHIKSNNDLMDLDVNQIRNYQLILLPASEISSKENREKYNMRTKFRVLPNCFGNYKVYKEKFTSFELDEICTSNNALSFEDYLECRDFDLTIELVYNNGIFKEIINFLKLNNIKPSTFVTRMNRVIPKNMAEVYKEFRKETKDSLWEDRNELKRFLNRPENVVRGDSSQEFRTNEIFVARALVFFKKMKSLHEIVFNEARNLLNKTERNEMYLKELYDLSLSRKEDILINKNEVKKFHFNFVELEKNKFNDDPFKYINPAGIEIEIAHTPEQREIISKNIQQYGDTIDGLGHILHRNLVNMFYRNLKLIE